LSKGALGLFGAVGAAVAPGLVLGALFGIDFSNGVDRWSGVPIQSARGAAITFVKATALIDWFPRPSRGFHLGGGLGVSAENFDTSVVHMARADLALNALAGYDWRATERWSFGLLLEADYYTPATLHFQDGGDSGYRLGGGTIRVAGSALLF
jgi:hypothetical protein